jgi:hypothetical protein
MTKFIPALVGVLIALLVAGFTPLFPPIVAEDVVQPRLNQALPVLSDGITIEQVIVPPHNGLTSIELQLARYDPAPASGTLTLELIDAQGQSIFSNTFNSQSLSHNQFLTLDFPAQPASQSSPYTIRATGTGGNPFSLWGYTLPALGEANPLTLTGATSTAQVLLLTSKYQLLGTDALLYLATRTFQEGGLWLLALAFMALPGVLILLVGAERPQRSPLHSMDSTAWWGLAIAIGLSVWALLWMWLSLVGFRWNGWLLWTVFLLGWLAVITLLIRQKRRFSIPNTQYSLLVPILLLATFAIRLLAIRDLTIPPWVDSIRHALITTLMVEKGQVLTDYAPLLPIDRFPYHFGFHTIPASLILMTGWELDTLLLSLGQLLNALAPLAVYTGAWLLTRRRTVALGAAFLVAFPFLFPGYYATWGRYTQLTGMLILPPMAGLLVRLIAGAKGWRGTWWLVALLSAGLFLAHIRVFIYLLPLPLVVWLWNKGRNFRYLIGAGLLGGVLVLPRVWYLLPKQASPSVFLNNIPDYNTFPTGYYLAGWEQYFAIAAIGATLLVILANARQRGWTTPLLYIALWIGFLFSTLAGGRVGLPESWLVNLNSMVITLFFPQSLMLAAVFVRVWHWVQQKIATRRVPVWVSNMLFYAGITLLLLFGIRFQTTILNPQTVLAYPDDRPALQWVAENTPTDAVFAVNSWRWLGNTWSGSDGGAWLVPLVHRASKTPPADYEYNADLTRQVVAFNEELNTITDWRDPANTQWLKSQGVTHLFIGTRGGTLDPAALIENPTVELLYQHGGAFVFALN